MSVTFYITLKTLEIRENNIMNHAKFLGAVALLVFSAGASAENYELDMGHSRIWFDVAHQGYSTMVGRFSDFGGTIDFDADNPTASSVDITINTASVDMFHDGLNDHLTRIVTEEGEEPRIDFFGVEMYPEMRFVSTNVEDMGEGKMAVTGDLTMLGQTHPVSLNAVLNRTGDARGTPKVGFSATGTVDRTQYGMSGFGAGNPFGLGADINVRIEIEATASGD